MKLLWIEPKHKTKHNPETNGDNGSIYNSIKADYILPDEFRNFNDASIEIEKAFSDYNECRPHSSIDYLHPRGFRRKFLNDPSFRKGFEKKEVEVKLNNN